MEDRDGGEHRGLPRSRNPSEDGGLDDRRNVNTLYPNGHGRTIAPGHKGGPLPREDTQFGEAIQKSVESYGFVGVPLSYQEARIYHWHQAADRLIGQERIPKELLVDPVITDEWIHPNDPRLAGLAVAPSDED